MSSRHDSLTPVLTLIATPWLGWDSGSAAYRAVLAVWFRQTLSRGDAIAAAVSVAIATALTAPPLSALVAAYLNKRIAANLVRAVVGFIVGAIGGVLPAALIALFWSGGQIRAIRQPELRLLFVWTAVLNGSIVAGISFHSRFWARLLR